LRQGSTPIWNSREGDAEGLGFTSHSFDSVVMNFGMLHLARPEARLRKPFVF
jgi:ubiquinone/menaquinone biosynthesis C-methylase UbiE